MNKINILEATLRDGSYTVNNQFTAQDTKFITKLLDEIGFKYIEIGPGIGFNAKSKTNILPASEDIEYIRAARKSAKKSKIGMFFIPGVGRKEDLEMAAKEGLDFVRIGINITEYENAYKYIECANRLGLITTVNLMKSYVVDSMKYARINQELYKNGAKIIYLVDSAGGMLPNDIKEYINNTKDLIPDLKVGFHGHDNLSLSMANTLAAIESGAEFVDTTIKGIGRSSGNTNTEKLVLILDRLGYQHNFDIDKLLNVGENVILPYLENKFESTTDYILGYSQFHSSYLNSIYKVSKEYNVDSNKLIIEYSKIDKTNMDENVLSKIAKNMRKRNNNLNNFVITNDIQYDENDKEQLKLLRNKFIEFKNKYGNKIFFNLARSYKKNRNIKISPIIHTIENISYGSCEVPFKTQNYYEILECLNDVVDGFLIDNRILGGMQSDKESYNDKFKNKVFYYSDSIMFAKSVYNYLKHIINKDRELNKIYVDIYDEVYSYLKALLNDLNINLVSNISAADIAVVGKSNIDKKAIINSNNIKWMILTSPGKIDVKLVQSNDEINYIRIDFERELFSEILENINYKELFYNEYGSLVKDGISYCSGGFIGKKGALVVDNINKISKIYGESKGNGSIEYIKKHND